jgi:hypothetical protein
MPTHSFALEHGQPKRLKLAWKWGWKDLTISLDGQPVGSVPDQLALTGGQDFPLPDGSSLHVRLVRRMNENELELRCDGKPLPGTSSDPLTVLNTAGGIIYLVAGFNLLVGLAALLFDIPFLRQMGIGLATAVFGASFFLLGYLVRQRSLPALLAAIIAFALDGILRIGLASYLGYTPGVAGILARLILIVPMIQGVAAINALRPVTKKKRKK